MVSQQQKAASYLTEQLCSLFGLLCLHGVRQEGEQGGLQLFLTSFFVFGLQLELNVSAAACAALVCSLQLLRHPTWTILRHTQQLVGPQSAPLLLLSSLLQIQLLYMDFMVLQ